LVAQPAWAQGRPWTMVELGATSPPLVVAPTAGALSLLQAADAFGRLDAAPTSRAPPGPSPSLVVDAPQLTGVDAASPAPALDGDSTPSMLPDMVQHALPPRCGDVAISLFCFFFSIFLCRL
jgi:hypothetical protein